MGVLKIYRQKLHTTVAENVTSTFIPHVPNYPASCNTPYIGNILSISTKHHHMMGGLAFAMAVTYLADGSFTTAPFVNLTLISNVLRYLSPSKLKIMTTHGPSSGTQSHLFVILVVKKARACPIYVPNVDYGSTTIVLRYHAWSNIYDTSTLSTLPTLLRTIISSTDFANFVF